MARSDNNLKAVLEDTAEAIRNKKGTSDPIIPRDFADEIDSIPQQGVDRSADILTDNLFSYKFPNEIGTTNPLKTYAFAKTNIKEIDLNKTEIVPSYAFNSAYLTKCIGSNVYHVLEGGLSYCRNLKTISFDNLGFASAYGFCQCSILESAPFSNLIEAKGSCFAYCYSLDTINFPDCLELGNNCFNSCSSLRYVSVFNLGSTSHSSVFTGCSRLKEVNVTGQLFLGAGCFNNCYAFSQITGENYIYWIGSSCFSNCSSLSKIDLLNANYIGANAFYNCSSLKEIFLLATPIQSSLFNFCKSLESVYILACSIPTLYSNAFTNTPIVDSSYLGHFGSIYVPSSWVASFKSATNWALYSDRITALPSEFDSKFAYAYEFASRSDLTEIPSEKLNVERVLWGAFYDCLNLQNVSLENCIRLSPYAFRGCSKLSDIYLPNCKIVPDYAFYSCSSLANLYLPECVVFVSPLENVKFSLLSLPKCKYISTNFSGVSSMELYLPDGKYVNLYAGSFVSLYCPNPIFTRLTGYTRYSHSGLINAKHVNIGTAYFSELNLPNCILFGIGSNNNSIISINMPKVQFLSAWAFQTCSNLKDINLPICTFLSSNAFASCKSIEKIHFPMLTMEANVTTMDQFANCFSLSKGLFNNLVHVTSGMFANCSSLESLYLFNNAGTNLTSSNAFNNTPIVDSSYLGYYGSIFVPSKLLSWYQTTIRWSQFSDRFVGLTDEEMQNVIDHFDD